VVTLSAASVQFGKADLSSCDREQIQLPGSIQPYGILLVIDREGFAVEQVAGDTEFMLGIKPARTLGQSLLNLLDPEAEAFITANLNAATTFVAPIIRLGVFPRGGAMQLDLTLTADGSTAIVELEPARRTRSGSADPIALLKTLLAALHQSTTVQQCLTAAAVTLRATTGFDRAMVYRFLEDGSGVVVAEDAAPGIERFLGLHYPASDIPLQARELYKRNWLRAIPRIDYEPAALHPCLNPRTGQSIDMSHCTLRSVAPTHLEYLRNMGVTASLSLSVVCQGEFWGMLMLHHYSPRHVPADLRVACETFAQIFSLQIETKIQAERSVQRIAARRIREQLVAGLVDSSDPGAALATTGLLQYVSAGGAAVYLDGRLHKVGVTPTDAELLELIAWLNTMAGPLFSTRCLTGDFSEPLGDSGKASGMLAVSLSRTPRDYVLWFRSEIGTTVRWAGNPAKPASGPLGERLTPRASFAEWLESSRLVSEAWSDVELESAEALRVGLLEAVLNSMDRIRLEREKAMQRQNLLLAELDQRVKNALAKIQALMRSEKAGAASVSAFASTIDLHIEAMALTDNLLAEGRWIGASLSKIIGAETAPFSGDGSPRVVMRGADVFLTPHEALALSLVLQELTTNALKHGALSAPAGVVSIEWDFDEAARTLNIVWRERGGPRVEEPILNGIGLDLIERTIGQELHGSVAIVVEAAGLRCDVSLPTGDLKTR
jgi:light-regulated signal transduction histidine kinase (bacteriophytochrome)